ncbi:heat-inducible transcriptional repressor HrcA [Subtercola boreus]|uniref:Heat-inducible transcription repressor HrcA n=1 Tax=Subtercola boreus TaxID=120213 RepID=A0A3E0VG25_9MICO|nr:heat-inducible transcriptional repressor HrcA [Subtercola boreus]RFA08906.1 heat-inducible transcriptional repressor HrcA [Subtercola boreus]TQL54110.1 heat-inducible transcription repressor HrcA [Subtercola boreus]
MVSERSLEVLRVIVHDYVESREPVGSKSIVDRHSFGVSAATIRNDMALLEEEELITAPHTSSGRIPTDKGYRLFVDHLSELKPLTAAQRQAIETFLGSSVDLDDVLARTVRLLSQLTQQVAMVQYPSLSTAKVRHIEVVALAPLRMLTVVITDTGHVEQRIVEVPADIDDAFLADLRTKANASASGLGLDAAAARLAELSDQFSHDRRASVAAVSRALIEQVTANRQEKLIIAGAANLVRTEGDFAGSILPVLEAVEEQVVLLRLFSEMQADQHGMSVRIGRENAPFGLAETSVLASGYSGAGTALARLGVLGPTRMDYSTNIQAVRAVARYLSKTLGEN